MRTAAPHNGTKTSREAARKIARHMPKLRAKVYLAIVLAGSSGITDEQIQTMANVSGNTERPRRIELYRMGLVKPCGFGRNMSGRKAVKWAKT